MDSISIIRGRLTKDPATKATNKGVSVTTLSVAVNDYRDGEVKKTNYWSVSTFGKLADTCSAKLSKGWLVLAIGKSDATLDTDRETPRMWLNLEATEVMFIAPPMKTEEKKPEPDLTPTTLDAFADVTSDDVPF